MSVKKNNVNQNIISNISINGNLISWEKNSVSISGISRIWIGNLPEEPFPVKTFLILLFITLSGQHYIAIMAMAAILALGSAMWLQAHRQDKTPENVNIQLISGDIFSFTSDNEDSRIQFYSSIKEAAESSNISEINFDSDGTIVKIAEEEPKAKAPGIMEISGRFSKNEKLVGELQKLYQSYTKKTDADSEILLLINDTARLLETDDRAGLKAFYQKFVTLGMIGDCNELGLDSLLQEIKSNLY